MAEPNSEDHNRPDELKAALIQHLQEVVRERDPFWDTAGHFYVQHYIRQQWSQWGEVTTHEFDYRGQTCQNLILDLPAVQPAATRPPILVGAHYDAVLQSPGADDNATGLAVLLELARWFARHPGRFPIRLVAFDLEEYGLIGSRAYAADLRQQNQALRLMLSLEMLGYCDVTPNSQRYPPGLQYFYPNCGNFIGLIGNWPTLLDLIRLSWQINRTGLPCRWLPAGLRGQIVPDTRRSDHAPFWDQGYRALMVTDTANLRNPHYHRNSDRIETLDLNFLTGVCRGLMAALQAL